MACIAAIEEVEQAKNKFANETLVTTIAFAKLLVALRQGDAEKSDRAVRALIKHPHTTFNTAIAAVKTVQQTMKETDRQIISEYYKLLAGKYAK
jgi:hypothetical protein